MASLHETCCPQCGCRDTHKRADALAPGFDNGNGLFWLLGGIVFSILWSLAKPKRYVCGQCEHFFVATTLAMRVWLIIMLAVFASCVFGVWLELHPEE
jgi:hypothetical protein